MKTIQAFVESKQSAKYNFVGVAILGAQKLDKLTKESPQSLGELVSLLGRAEILPPDNTVDKKYACSELVECAFRSANVMLSNASGFTPGDMVRLGQAGYLMQVGRIQIPVVKD